MWIQGQETGRLFRVAAGSRLPLQKAPFAIQLSECINVGDEISIARERSCVTEEDKFWLEKAPTMKTIPVWGASGLTFFELRELPRALKERYYIWQRRMTQLHNKSGAF